MATSAYPPISSNELGGCRLAGVRQLRDERERRRCARWRSRQVAMAGSASNGINESPSYTARSPKARHGPGQHNSPRCHTPQNAIGEEGIAHSTDTMRIKRVSPRQRRRVEKTHAYLCTKVDPVMGRLILALLSARPTHVRDAALRHLFLAKNKRNCAHRDGDVCGKTNDTATNNEPDRQGQGHVEKATCEVCRGSVVSCPKHLEHRDDRHEDIDSMGDSGAQDGSRGSNRTAGNAVKRLAQRKDRLFMAREIGPLVTELIHRTLRHMPMDVESFLIQQLQAEDCGSPSPLRETFAQETDNAKTDRDGGKTISNDSNRTSPMTTPRPSTARNRLQQAQNMDLEVQRSSPPREPKERRSPSPPGRPRDRPSDNPRDRVIAEGVRESKNKPWDVEIASRANLPPSHAESLPPGTAAAQNKAPQVAVILLLGIDGAGKTTLLGTLQGEHDPRVRPTVGFKPVTMMLSDQLKVKFYDLGGGAKIRSIWDNYYHDAHGVIYVVDGSDAGRWKESKDQYLAALDHKYLRGKPVAVMLNKEDAGLQLDADSVAEELDCGSESCAKVWRCSANSARAKGGTPDVRLEGAVERLLGNIQANFIALNERVQRDLQDMEREFQKEKERKHLAVLRSLLRKAFPSTEGAEQEDCFDETEGLEFLTSEVGLENDMMLPAEGAEIAALVGYQRLALQMVGNMKCPISRKNPARSWEEIRQLILDLRQEIGII